MWLLRHLGMSTTSPLAPSAPLVFTRVLCLTRSSPTISPYGTPELGRLGAERNLGAGVGQEVLEASLCYRKASDNLYKPGSAPHASEEASGRDGTN